MPKKERRSRDSLAVREKRGGNRVKNVQDSCDDHHDSNHVDNSDMLVDDDDTSFSSPSITSRRSSRSARISSSSVKSTPVGRKVKDNLGKRSTKLQKGTTKNNEDETSSPLKAFNHFHGYHTQAEQLKSMLKSCINGIESSTVLICGPRGSGKTTLLDECLKEILNGKEDSVEVMSMSGFLDTDPVHLFRSVRISTGAEEVSISFLLKELLDKVTAQQKSLLFILDAFDLFCRKNQTFLYNIFDLGQKCTRVGVVGMTTRLDCLELMEKRVKSRMSQNVIHLNTPFSNAKEYEEYAKMRYLTLVSHPDAKKEKKLPDSLSQAANTQYKLNSSVGHMQRFLTQYSWNSISGKQDKVILDPIISSITSLSHLELLILVMAFKYCKVRNIDSFPCNALISECGKFSGRTKITREVAYKLIHNLISYGLLIKSSQNKTTCNFINDWSILSVGVREEDLKTALSKLWSTLPASLHAQVTIN